MHQQFQFLAGTGSAAVAALFRFLERDNPGLIISILIGGIAGAICFAPAYFLIDKRKLSGKMIKPLLWTNIIAGAIAGLCLAIPVGFALFFYVAYQAESNPKK